MESEACKKPHGSINSLKKSIKAGMNKIDIVDIIDAVAAFRQTGCLKAVIAVEGGHIEKLYAWISKFRCNKIFVVLGALVLYSKYKK